MTFAAANASLKVPFAARFEGPGGRRTLWLLGLGMVLFGLAELPALVTMSAHGTSVLGFERAGTTHRLNEILFVWGAHGRAAAEAHVFIDLGFIACYGLLLSGLSIRLWHLYRHSRHRRVAQAAAVFSWAALIAAAVNILQKLILWLELHGHTAEPLPALASWCAAVTSLLAATVVLFSIGGFLVARPLRVRVLSDLRTD